MFYLAFKSSIIFAFKAAPFKSLATMVPVASKIKVAGIDCTLYCFAIGSSQNLRFEIWGHTKQSFEIASFHFAASLSKETPMIFKPLF